MTKPRPKSDKILNVVLRYRVAFWLCTAVKAENGQETKMCNYVYSCFILPSYLLFRDLVRPRSSATTLEGSA